MDPVGVLQTMVIHQLGGTIISLYVGIFTNCKNNESASHKQVDRKMEVLGTEM